MKFKVLFSSGIKKGPFNDAESAILYAKENLGVNRWAIIKKSVDGENYEDFSIISPEGKVMRITDAELNTFRKMKKISSSAAQETFNRGGSVVIVPMNYLLHRKLGDPTFKLTAKKSIKIPNWKFVNLIIKDDYDFNGKLEYFIEKIEENAEYSLTGGGTQLSSDNLKLILTEALKNEGRVSKLVTRKNSYNICNIEHLKEESLKNKLGGSGNALMFNGKLFRLSAKNIENLAEMITEAEGKTVKVFIHSGFKSLEVQIPGPYNTLDEIKEKAESIEDYFFSPNSLKFFSSRPSGNILFGRFFIDSVRMKSEGTPRVYRVMVTTDEGRTYRVAFPSSTSTTRLRKVNDVNGEDMFFTDFADARSALNSLKLYLK